MSGYLEVKYPFKSNLGLNPFKSWKRQWCILRPSPTSTGGSLAVYCSEAGAPAGTVELSSGCVVRRAKSRTRPHAFAVFSVSEPRKARVLLAASTLQDAQVWMDKIKVLLSGSKLLGTENQLKDTYSVSVLPTELARKCGLSGSDGVVTISASGVIISRSQHPNTCVPWKHITDVTLTEDADKTKSCVITVDSGYGQGAGQLCLWSPAAGGLLRALRGGRWGTQLTRSQPDLTHHTPTDTDEGEGRRSSWYSGPSDVSLDDLHLVMTKECKRGCPGFVPRSAGGELLPGSEVPELPTLPAATRSLTSFDDSMCDRRSLASIASGIYEEIPDLPLCADAEALYCKMTHKLPDAALKSVCVVREEPMYESVWEAGPPPLPPRDRLPTGSSVSMRPRTAHTLPKLDKRQPFSVFRKRLKSDSRIASPKSETVKEKDVETKKKKFDFTPTRDIFKSFKVSRKMKNLKITGGSLAKGETKSCEFLDSTEHVPTNRCSKSVECLETNNFIDDFDADLSIELNDDAVAALSLPKELVDLLLGRDHLNKIRLKDQTENEYMPMSPIVPAPLEHHYIVMSPRPNLA